MTSEQIKYIIHNQALKRMEEHMHEIEFYDVWETCALTESVKYIDRDGKIRLDIDFEEFKQLFEQALYNCCLMEIQYRDTELMKKTPYRIRKAMELYTVSADTMKKCDMIMHVNPLFDNRKKGAK